MNVYLFYTYNGTIHQIYRKDNKESGSSFTPLLRRGARGEAYI